jgi:iron complex transport system substrate-binding protein
MKRSHTISVKFSTRRWVRGLLTAIACAVSVVAHAQTVVDDRGVTIQFERPPQRIVSLLPSLTETVCALGQCARLVGVDRYSNYPASVKALPNVGGGLDPNIEAIAALRPDLVLAATSSRVHERLSALGIRAVALEPQNHAQARSAFERVGRVLGLDEAAQVQPAWQTIENGVDAVARALPVGARNLKVYFEVSSAPHAAGEQSFIGQTLARLGARNIVPANLGPFPKLNPEFVVRADPDVIIVGDRNAQNLAQRPGWAAMRAVRERRVCMLSEQDADVAVRPGPRMAQAAQIMAQCLQRHAPK